MFGNPLIRFLLATALFLPAAGGELQAQPKPLVWSTKNLPRLDRLLSIENPSETVHDFFLDDFDGDGHDELCQLRTDPNHSLFLAVRELLFTGYTCPGRALTLDKIDYALFPLRGGRIRFALYRRSEGKGWIDLYNNRLVKIDSLSTLAGQDVSGDGRWTGRLVSLFLCDINQDERPDLGALFNTGADQKPRALVIYDLKSKNVLLQQHFAPMLSSAIPVDYNGDGAMELLLTLGGASDGPYFGPFSRDSSYIALMAPDGRILAKKCFGGESSYVNAAVADLDGDRVPEIIAAPFALVQTTAKMPFLLILDSGSLKIKAVLPIPVKMASVYNLMVQDMDEDGNPEILLGDLADHVAVADFDAGKGTLTVSAMAQSGGSTRPVLVDDLNQDGRSELFAVTTSPPALWLTDADLHPLAWMPLQEPSRFKMVAQDRLRASHRVYTLLDGHTLKHLPIQVDTYFPASRAILRILGKEISFRLDFLHYLSGLLLLLLFGAGVVFVWIARSSRYPDRLYSNRVGHALVDSKGRIIRCNPYFLRLVGEGQTNVLKQPIAGILTASHLQVLQSLLQAFIRRGEIHEEHEIDLQVDGLLKNIAVELIRPRDYRSTVALLLVDLSESLQKERLKIWAAMAMRMAHKTKTPLATILLAIQRLQRAYKKNSPEHVADYEAMTRTALHEIERVRDSINAFMKFARLDPPAFVYDDLSRIVQESLQEYLPRIPDEVQLQTKFAELELPIYIDPGQFREAFYNLLDNAISAIRGEGRLTISTLLERNPLSSHGVKDQALLEIADDGVGIPLTDLPQLFTKGFSTSFSGTGMGLPLARSIIEAHNGTIDIDSRQPGGTIVFVRLPIQQA
jgi:signal transduction histidine kinase